jgi:parvulin-like peptidyl-prolyl isomerase
MKREQILKEIIKEQHRVIDSLKESVEQYKSASDLDKDSATDPDDLARQTEAKDMQLRFEKMLQKEKNDLEFVLKEIDKQYSIIEFGALVETDKNYFFLAVPLPKISIKGKELFCISKEAPVFTKLLGKKIGDSIEMGTSQHTIINVL